MAHEDLRIQTGEKDVLWLHLGLASPGEAGLGSS